LKRIQRQVAVAIVHDELVDGLVAQNIERSVFGSDWHG
jgi:hypothetical protein